MPMLLPIFRQWNVNMHQLLVKYVIAQHKSVFLETLLVCIYL